MHATPMRFSGFIRPHKGEGERQRETERGACQLFANRKLSNAQNFKRRTFMLMRFESFLITFAPPRTHTHRNTQAHICVCGIENTLYAL